MLAGVESGVLQAINTLEGGSHTPAEAPPIARLHRHFPERVVSVMRERKQQVMSLTRVLPHNMEFVISLVQKSLFTSNDRTDVFIMQYAAGMSDAV